MRFAILAFFVASGCTPLVLQPEAPGNTTAPTTIEEPTPFDLPPEDARSVEEFDTTTREQREEATATTTGGDALGTTVASLGDASQPGFWLETPLVSAPTTGRVRNPETGRTVQVDLRPIDGGSSRISLAALRLLEAPLTDLVTLEVFVNG